jgi:hypothetical protein
VVIDDALPMRPPVSAIISHISLTAQLALRGITNHPPLVKAAWHLSNHPKGLVAPHRYDPLYVPQHHTLNSFIGMSTSDDASNASGADPYNMPGCASGAEPVSHAITSVVPCTELFRGGYPSGTLMGWARCLMHEWRRDSGAE